MLLERTASAHSRGLDDRPSTSPASPEPPLTCMMYFFVSQMSWNMQTPDEAPPAHPLDKLLARLGVHAAFSPLVTQFETFPVEIPQPPGTRRSKVPKEVMHDTMLLIKFRSKRAREEWTATKEWGEFREKTESEGVFRRLPHVRCAGTLRGLSDPMEVLGI